jgi:AcrR family transcriptional regulator
MQNTIHIRSGPSCVHPSHHQTSADLRPHHPALSRVTVISQWPSPSRAESKKRTRQILLDAALRCLETRPFSHLGLREVTREAGIATTAFYRHFASMDELGLALAAEAAATATELAAAIGRCQNVHDAVDLLVDYVAARPAHFQLLTGERSSGNGPVDTAIRDALCALTGQLAAELASRREFRTWNRLDTHNFAALVINTMLAAADALLHPGANHCTRDARARTIQHLQMILLGVPHWRG